MKDKRKGDIKKACNLPQYAYNMIKQTYLMVMKSSSKKFLQHSPR